MNYEKRVRDVPENGMNEDTLQIFTTKQQRKCCSLDLTTTDLAKYNPNHLNCISNIDEF